MNIPELHRLYCAITGLELQLRFDREHFWHDWQKAGYTSDDLILVVRMVQRKIKTGERREGALKFSNLIERLDYFEEDLAIARAEKKNWARPRSAKERALERLRPTVVEPRPPDTARPVSVLISELKQAAGMRP